ncbi:MAG: chromosome segregation protein SMC, partial [Candidatus Eremiobacteraeota bacterium]|nr:chromosome segregation protein SMC [Candidatus Eremiobacteraeota bacterium]
LEETAGVNRYKFRKKEARRRLEKTEDNLTRLRDILKEVEDQLVESQKQLQRYERYKKSQDELKSLDRRVAQHELDEMGRQRGELETRLAEMASQRDQAQVAETQHRQSLERLRLRKHELDLEKENRANEIAGLREQAGATRAAHEGIFRRASELEHSARAAQARLGSSGQRIEAQDQRLQELGQRRPDLEQQVEQARQEVERLLEQLQQLPAPDQGPNAEIRVKLANIERQKNALVAAVSQLEARLESDQARLEEIELQWRQLDSELGQLLPDELPIEAARQALTQAEGEVQQARAQQTALQEERRSLAGQRQELERKRRPAVSRVAELEALLEDRSGLPPAVRQVMAWKVDGTVGLLGELVRVPEGLEQAYEAALGGHINDIVTRDRRVASELIERLKQERIGRVTFWPLDLSRRPGKPPELPDRRGVVGRALELLGYPPEIEVVLNEILGKTVIMENLPVALALYDRCFGRRPHLVTREGEYLNPSGALTGGRRRQSGVGVLARRRMLEEARSELLTLDNGLIALSEKEEKAQAAQAAASERLNGLQEAVHQRRRTLVELEAEEKRRQSDQQRVEQRKQRLTEEKAKLVERGQQARLELDKHTQTRTETEAEQARLQAEFERNQEEESRLNRLRESLNQQRMEAKLELERRQQHLRDLERECEREATRRQELVNDQKEAEAEHQRCLEARAKLEVEGQDLQAKLTGLEQELTVKNTTLEELRRSTQTLDRQTSDAADAYERAAAATQKWTGKIANLQVDMARVVAHFEEAEARLEQYGPAPEGESAEMTSQELENARGRIKRLKSFLDNFGGVNLGAREDHERLTERHLHLKTQIDDLTEGAASLKKIMAELDKATVTQFEKTFHEVNNTFSRLFTDLFSGGQARLELCDPNDVLESGVEIVACPPGKRMQNMTLLSSGERALTAIAFLMSLLACKPSPIVILDELDAPLDERNVEKVATRLLEFSTSSQFLVITHNRKTMEFADRLYGVTMVEPGISKVLSVELATVEQELGALG